jgi:hypothetical protein
MKQQTLHTFRADNGRRSVTRSSAPSTQKPRCISVGTDVEALKQVASTTGSDFFEGADRNALTSVYDELGSPVRTKVEQRAHGRVHRLEAALFAAGGVLSAPWFTGSPS